MISYIERGHTLNIVFLKQYVNSFTPPSVVLESAFTVKRINSIWEKGNSHTLYLSF